MFPRFGGSATDATDTTEQTAASVPGGASTDPADETAASVHGGDPATGTDTGPGARAATDGGAAAADSLGTDGGAAHDGAAHDGGAASGAETASSGAGSPAPADPVRREVDAVAAAMTAARSGVPATGGAPQVPSDEEVAGLEQAHETLRATLDRVDRGG